MDETTSKDLEAIEDLHRRDVAATKTSDFETLMSNVFVQKEKTVVRNRFGGARFRRFGQ